MDQECASSKFGGQEMLDGKPIKVSELISELNDILIEFGDLDCYRCDDIMVHTNNTLLKGKYVAQITIDFVIDDFDDYTIEQAKKAINEGLDTNIKELLEREISDSGDIGDVSVKREILKFYDEEDEPSSMKGGFKCTE